MSQSRTLWVGLKQSLVVAVVAVFAVGCASAPADEDGVATNQVADASLSAGDAVAPPDESVLTVGGAIANTNVDDELHFDLATLDRLTVVSGEVYEPWAEIDLAFQGVRLADILDLADVDDAATTVELIALDDYVVELPLEAIDESVVVATHAQDGAPIPVAEGGPTRVVFLDDASPLADPNNWIWSLASVTVR